jgi:hypothetical protein
MRLRIIAGAAVASAVATAAAFAHHGWDWAEEEQTERTGVIQEIYVGPPHPALQIESEGETWTIDLGNPRQTEASGFHEGSAEPGQEVLVRGHRSLDPEELRMKAVRITIEGQQYDLYPDRIVEDE